MFKSKLHKLDRLICKELKTNINSIVNTYN